MGHGLNSHPDELCRNSLAPVLLDDGEHGDIAAVGSAAVAFELADHYAVQSVRLAIKRLRRINSVLLLSLLHERTM